MTQHSDYLIQLSPDGQTVTYSLSFSSQLSFDDTYPLAGPSLSPASLLESVLEQLGALTLMSYPVDEGVIVKGLVEAPQLPSGAVIGSNVSCISGANRPHVIR